MADDTSVDSTWEKLRKSVLEASEETLGLKRPVFNRWISQATLDLSEKRRQARIHGRTAAAKILSKDIRRSVRKDKDAYSEQLAEDMENAASKGDSRKLFQLVKRQNVRKALPRVWT